MLGLQDRTFHLEHQHLLVESPAHALTVSASSVKKPEPAMQHKNMKSFSRLRNLLMTDSVTGQSGWAASNTV